MEKKRTAAEKGMAGGEGRSMKWVYGKQDWKTFERGLENNLLYDLKERTDFRILHFHLFSAYRLILSHLPKAIFGYFIRTLC